MEQNDLTLKVLQKLQVAGDFAKVEARSRRDPAALKAVLEEVAEVNKAIDYHRELMTLSDNLACTVNGLLAHFEQLTDGSHSDAVAAGEAAVEAWQKFQFPELQSEKNSESQLVFMVFKLAEAKWYYLVERPVSDLPELAIADPATMYGPFKTQEMATSHLKRFPNVKGFSVLDLEGRIIPDDIQKLIDKANKNMAALN